jgi:hypothetical protein
MTYQFLENFISTELVDREDLAERELLLILLKMKILKF